MKKNTILGLCGAVAALAFASSAYANTDATVFLWDGTAADNTTVVDGGIGDLNASAGAVTFSGPVGSWTINVDTGISKPTLGSAGHPSMDLNFVDASPATAGSLSIAFFDDGDTATLAGALATIGGTLGQGVTLNYSTYTHAGNTSPTFTGGALNLGAWTLLTSQTFTTTPFSGSTSGGVISGGADPYSLIQVITLTADRTAIGGSSSGNATLKAPDGGMTLMLLGSSLTALAFLRRSFKSGKA